jgi:DNA-binding response OmpR family regulator
VSLTKILVADDEPHIVKLLSSSLQSAGFSVVATTRVDQVLDKARAEQHDLIVLSGWTDECLHSAGTSVSMGRGGLS